MTAEVRDPQRHQHPSPPHPAASQPATQALRTWWKQFTSVQKFSSHPKHPGPYPIDKDDRNHTVFGKPLKESLKYASVQISTASPTGELYVWGYIPVVVAKCGLFLKENATEVEGTFRISGSNKRMRELQAIFETPPRYGKSLDWKQESYTTHDVASVFRRYLTQMPEPVIPYDMYFPFRNAIANKPYNQDEVIMTYKQFIAAMPRANQYLLLYVLDLLSVFARKCDKNLMTAHNLAVIFRPGIMSHPKHDLEPNEHQLSQEVVEFLIAQQDWFMLDTPARPPGRERGSLSSEDDVGGHLTSGSWQIVGAPAAHPYPHPQASGPIARSRTTMDRERERARIHGHGHGHPGIVTDSEDTNSDSAATHLQPVTVTRSRTLPSQQSSTAGSAAGGEEERTGRVLRKTRRLSAQHVPTVAKTVV